MTDEPQRLTFVITSLGLGGAQQQVRTLSGRLRDRGWDVDVVVLLHPDEARPLGGLPEGVRSVSLGMRRRPSDVLALPRLVRHLRRRRPAVVHAHMVHANLLARLARPFARVPVLVCTAHSPHEGGRAIDLAYRVTDRLADVTTNVSAHAASAFVARGAVPSDRIRVVANGLELSAYGPRSTTPERIALRAELGVPPDRFAWLNAGRLAPEKDLTVLLRAVAMLRGRAPAPHLLVAGDGPERRALEALAHELELTEHVTFLGYRSDVVRLMRGTDAFVMSSAWEGLPIVLLEAGACRLPSVATDVGGTRDVLLDGISGRVAPPGDPAGLAAAMAEVASASEDVRRRMGEAARRHVATVFDLERVTDVWEKLYRELRTRRPRSTDGDAQP